MSSDPDDRRRRFLRQIMRDVAVHNTADRAVNKATALTQIVLEARAAGATAEELDLLREGYLDAADEMFSRRASRRRSKRRWRRSQRPLDPGRKPPQLPPGD